MMTGRSFTSVDLPIRAVRGRVDEGAAFAFPLSFFGDSSCERRIRVSASLRSSSMSIGSSMYAFVNGCVDNFIDGDDFVGNLIGDLLDDFDGMGFAGDG